MSLNGEPWSVLQTEELSSRNKLKRSYCRKQRAVFGCLIQAQARKQTKCHLPAVAGQIYFMSKLHCKLCDRVIRIRFLRGIAEQYDVEARTNLRYFLHWLQEPTSRNTSNFLSRERGIRECRSYTVCRVFIYFINGTFSDANRCKLLPVKLSFD